MKALDEWLRTVRALLGLRRDHLLLSGRLDLSLTEGEWRAGGRADLEGEDGAELRFRLPSPPEPLLSVSFLLGGWEEVVYADLPRASRCAEYRLRSTGRGWWTVNGALPEASSSPAALEALRLAGEALSSLPDPLLKEGGRGLKELGSLLSKRGKLPLARYGERFLLVRPPGRRKPLLLPLRRRPPLPQDFLRGGRLPLYGLKEAWVEVKVHWEDEEMPFAEPVLEVVGGRIGRAPLKPGGAGNLSHLFTDGKWADWLGVPEEALRALEKGRVAEAERLAALEALGAT